MTEVDFYYCPEDNVIRDSDDNIIYDIFRYVTPNDLLFLKTMKQTICVESRKFDAMIFINYPDKDEEEV